MSTFQNYILEITNSDGIKRANLSGLVSDLNILNEAFKQYNLLFNNLFKNKSTLISEIEKLITEISNTSLTPNARNSKQRVLRIKSNLVGNKEEISKARTEANVARVQEIIQKYIDNINQLIEALTAVQRDVFRTEAKLIFKDPLFGKSAAKKSSEFFEQVSGMILSLKSQKRQFIRIKEELRTAVNTTRSEATSRALQARLNSLRGISAAAAPGISAPEQRNDIIAALNKVKKRVGGATRKRRHTRRRHTRRN
jgi:predicted DNA-binding protein